MWASKESTNRIPQTLTRHGHRGDRSQRPHTRVHQIGRQPRSPRCLTVVVDAGNRSHQIEFKGLRTPRLCSWLMGLGSYGQVLLTTLGSAQAHAIKSCLQHWVTSQYCSFNEKHIQNPFGLRYRSPALAFDTSVRTGRGRWLTEQYRVTSHTYPRPPSTSQSVRLNFLNASFRLLTQSPPRSPPSQNLMGRCLFDRK